MKPLFTPTNHLDRDVQNAQQTGNRIQFSKVLFFCCLAAFTCAGSSFKKEAHHSSLEKTIILKKPVPFKGRLAVVLGAGGTAGEGVGSHIGRFDYTSVDDLTNFPFVTGTATITAANGDQIFTSFSGQLSPVSSDLFTVSLNNIITGGTGRFAGASGSYTSTGTANTGAGTATTTFTGTINY